MLESPKEPEQVGGGELAEVSRISAQLNDSLGARAVQQAVQVVDQAWFSQLADVSRISAQLNDSLGARAVQQAAQVVDQAWFSQLADVSRISAQLNDSLGARGVQQEALQIRKHRQAWAFGLTNISHGTAQLRVVHDTHIGVDDSMQSAEPDAVEAALNVLFGDEDEQALSRLSAEDRGALAAALVFVIVGCAVLAAMELAPEVFDQWAVWVSTTTGLTALLLQIMQRKNQ